MGTDIYGIVEAKEAKTGKWLAISEINDTRDYLWFGIIAGVRMSYHSIFDFGRRGFPEDASPAWREARYDDWLHGHTWLTPSEVKFANIEYRKRIIDEYETATYVDISVDKLSSREKVYEMSTVLTKLVLEIRYPESLTIPWAGTLGEFIGEDADIDACVRYNYAFSS